MPERLRREDFLHALESVAPALAKARGVLQSDCFIFDNGWVIAYTDEARCRAPSGLPKTCRGATNAKKLQEYLASLKDEEIEIDFRERELVIGHAGRERKAHRFLEGDVQSNYADVGVPKNWRPLPDNFGEAIGLVQECAKIHAAYELVVVHVTPDFVEACDNFQLCRWWLKTGFTISTLLRKEFVRHVASLGMTEVSEEKNWVHFRNPGGVQLAIRRNDDPYPDWEEKGCFRAKGKRAALPKAFAEGARLGQKFSQEREDDDRVMVEIRPGHGRVRAFGLTGRFEDDWCKVEYSGDPFAFMISPGMLSSIVEKYPEVILGEKTITVSSGKPREGAGWMYVAWLAEPPKDAATQAEEFPAEGPSTEEGAEEEVLEEELVGDE